MKKNKIKNKLNKVNPDRIIQTIEENFNVDDSLGLLYSKRMQVGEGFRYLKSLFDFNDLVLKDTGQSRRTN